MSLKMSLKLLVIVLFLFNTALLAKKKNIEGLWLANYHGLVKFSKDGKFQFIDSRDPNGYMKYKINKGDKISFEEVDSDDVFECSFKLNKDTLFLYGEFGRDSVFTRISDEDVKSGKKFEKKIEGEWTILKSNLKSEKGMLNQFLSKSEKVTFVFKNNFYFLFLDFNNGDEEFRYGKYRVYGKNVIFIYDEMGYTGPSVDLSDGAIIFNQINKLAKSKMITKEYIDSRINDLNRPEESGNSSILKSR